MLCDYCYVLEDIKDVIRMYGIKCNYMKLYESLDNNYCKCTGEDKPNRNYRKSTIYKKGVMKSVNISESE